MPFSLYYLLRGQVAEAARLCQRSFRAGSCNAWERGIGRNENRRPSFACEHGFVHCAVFHRKHGHAPMNKSSRVHWPAPTHAVLGTGSGWRIRFSCPEDAIGTCYATTPKIHVIFISEHPFEPVASWLEVYSRRSCQDELNLDSSSGGTEDSQTEISRKRLEQTLAETRDRVECMKQKLQHANIPVGDANHAMGGVILLHSLRLLCQKPPLHIP